MSLRRNQFLTILVAIIMILLVIAVYLFVSRIRYLEMYDKLVKEYDDWQKEFKKCNDTNCMRAVSDKHGFSTEFEKALDYCSKKFQNECSNDRKR